MNEGFELEQASRRVVAADVRTLAVCFPKKSRDTSHNTRETQKGRSAIDFLPLLVSRDHNVI